MSLAGAAVFAQAPITGAAAVVEASKQAEPGVAYGTVADFTLPKTILFSAGPDDIAADAEEWARRGVRAFFLDFVAREWSSNIWATDGKPWTVGESDETFQKARRANAVCRRVGSETFLKIAFDRHFEWFNDLLWDQAYHNFRQFAAFARETGCTGMALDIEYVGEQYHFDWPGYTYDGYTRADLVRKVHERMTRVLAILYDVFPDMVFLTFPEQGLGLGQVIHTAWIEEAARRVAPGGLHYCTEWTYRNPNVRYMFGHGVSVNELFHRLLSKRAWRYWEARCSIAAGVWPFGFDHMSVYDPGMPLEEFRQAYAASLMMSARYNWIYSHNCREQLIGRNLDAYTGDARLEDYLEVIRAREIITTRKYVDLAREIRALQHRDYSADLGLTPAITFAGPEDTPRVYVAPVEFAQPGLSERFWKPALAHYRGEPINLRNLFGTQTQWMIIGPFPNNEAYAGHDAAYPPETELNLDARYEGKAGPVAWVKYAGNSDRASVDLKSALQPSEYACAYALCYVVSEKKVQAQLRIGTNDSGKAWVGGELVYDYPYEGTAYLDRDVVPVTLPAGKTPVLVKVCNGQLNWGFALRFTDESGDALDDLQVELTP